MSTSEIKLKISVNVAELKDKTAQVFFIAHKPPETSISLAMHKDISSLIHKYHGFVSDKQPYGLPTTLGKGF